MNWSRIIPGSVVGTATLFLLLQLPSSATSPDEMALDEFATLPVVAEGRVKPIDTVARNSLMIISKRQTFKDEKGQMQPAIHWLLDTLVSKFQQRGKQTARGHKVFRIENDQLLGFLNLEERPGNYRYSLREIEPKWEDLNKEVRRIKGIDPKKHDKFDQAVLELRSHIELYLELETWETPLLIPVEGQDEDWKSYAQALSESFNLALERAKQDKNNQDLPRGELRARVLGETLRILAAHYPALDTWERILRAYQENRPKEFNQAVADFRKQQGQLPEGTETKIHLEVFFNHFAPFYQCAVLYIFVFLLASGGLLAYPQVLNRAAFWLCGLTLALHSAALLGRMYLQGRPPVTNLYSSAIFIGWGGVVLGMVLEWIYRNGIGNLLAAMLGGATALIAHHLAENSRDTLEMMQAVLDTQFWLATHVTCVTLGYAATFFAGFLGLVFILLGVFTRRLDRETFVSLGQMIYGVLCFATLLSFVGTVLGGIWADFSWGRFWGWDPKENGALMIVLMNALILHARWGGMVKQRGMAVLALVGNMVTGWSWFGTNQLSVGLHAYGFNKTLADGLAIFWITQLICIGVGLVPTRHWRSFGQVQPEPAQPTPKRRDRR
jgi:ABC-type transport system involved in cytochrome c biogenesis permease subunit